MVSVVANPAKSYLMAAIGVTMLPSSALSNVSLIETIFSSAVNVVRHVLLWLAADCCADCFGLQRTAARTASACSGLLRGLLLLCCLHQSEARSAAQTAAAHCCKSCFSLLWTARSQLLLAGCCAVCCAAATAVRCCICMRPAAAAQRAAALGAGCCAVCCGNNRLASRRLRILKACVPRTKRGTNSPPGRASCRARWPATACPSP